MMLYQIPVISTIKQEPFQSQLQYQPDCAGDFCSEEVGFNFAFFNNGSCQGGAEFFLPGRTDPTPPFGCVLVIEDQFGSPQNGTSCSYIGPLSCAEGQVWELDCSFPDTICDDGFQDTFISCNGETSGVCDGGNKG